MSSSSSEPMSFELFSPPQSILTVSFVSIDTIFLTKHPSTELCVDTHTVRLHLSSVIHLPTLMLHLFDLSSYVIITDTSSSDVYGSLNSPFKLMSLWIGVIHTVIPLQNSYAAHSTDFLFFFFCAFCCDGLDIPETVCQVVMMVLREHRPSLRSGSLVQE